uniref:DUF7742 family protein n=1 Tax=Yoonia phaeophyticola TaxID=3137369 RepID=UPI004038AAAC
MSAAPRSVWKLRSYRHVSGLVLLLRLSCRLRAVRAVQLADIEAAARALLVVPAHERAALATKICQRAQAADKYRRRLGRVHPDFGTGSILSAAARFRQAPRPDRICSDYLGCFAQVCTHLSAS